MGRHRRGRTGPARSGAGPQSEHRLGLHDFRSRPAGPLPGRAESRRSFAIQNRPRLGDDASPQRDVWRSAAARRVEVDLKFTRSRPRPLGGRQARPGPALGRRGTGHGGLSGIAGGRSRAELEGIRSRHAALESSFRKHRLRRPRRKHRRALHRPRAAAQELDWAAAGARPRGLRVVRLCAQRRIAASFQSAARASSPPPITR